LELDWKVHTVRAKFWSGGLENCAKAPREIPQSPLKFMLALCNQVPSVLLQPQFSNPKPCSQRLTRLSTNLGRHRPRRAARRPASHERICDIEVVNKFNRSPLRYRHGERKRLLLRFLSPPPSFTTTSCDSRLPDFVAGFYLPRAVEQTSAHLTTRSTS
jgi:hypothetical protein